ncbi:TetR/AcrR family transcriptional regulator [Vicingus serpentipes]|jgi:TetR/AcrR family transcriptional regulator, cholesterol catabolism regulator|uniref:TetR/AcrR family transcriptional regulator n=1 Tax=Vicingus serpentipes TaxID=1926625 RepID=A0A5C6RNE0_9FLAO|nr:TetR/AcrR family transcriptional regulator [Vicingus serpentipes]TXB63928.1 TetR/AcrR family transcriptional regulator [Vicingus serpentipes]
MDKHHHVIAEITKLFMKLGIKSLTMEDIARHVGISKKTLYLFVSDKNDLVKKGISLMIEHEKQTLSSAREESVNAIDELIGVTKCVSSEIGEIHPSVIFDLQKYHPEAWKLLENHKKAFIHSMMLDNLKRGIKEGYYRENINPEIIANIYIGMVDNILNPENPINKTLSIDKMHTEIIRYHIRGIANDKGLTYLKEALKNVENSKFDFN